MVGRSLHVVTTHLIMVGKMGKLTAKQLPTLSKGETKKHPDGGGLYFCVRESGSPYWMLRYTSNGKRKEMTLGRYPAMSLAEAHAESELTKREIRQGVDPIAEKERPVSVRITTVNDLAADWLKDCEKRLKHPGIPRRIYDQELAPVFGELGLDRIGPLDVRHAINKITESNRPSIANDALMYCKQLFRHGIRLDAINTNPADAFSVQHAGGIEKSRSRALSLPELTTVFRIFRDNADQFARENYLATALLVVLGVRKGELIAAKWEEFDSTDALWNLPEERRKTGAAISIPLPTVVVEWLEELNLRACGSEYVFPSRRSSKRRAYISDDTLNHAVAKLFGQKTSCTGKQGQNILGEAGIEHFTIHDLRRTCRTLLADAGVPGHVAERCLNHKLKGVEGIYDRYDYLDERREALQKIADLLTPIITPMSNVTSFRRKA